MLFIILILSVKGLGDGCEGEEEVYNMVSGPIGMTVVVSDVVDDVDDSLFEKVVNVVQMAGIISIGLVFTNMLPIPGLDGVQVMMIIIEMIMGHPVSKKTEDILLVVGFILLIGLALFAFASDIIRIIVE